MEPNERFAYHSLQELTEAFSRLGCDIPVQQDVSILGSPVQFGRLTVPNRLATQPMEGCDATGDGAPTDLTVRKYRRLAAGGAGLIWWEACAVVGEGRANPRQLWLREDNAAAFTEMLEATRQAAVETMGHKVVCVLQLTHSGRYSRPQGVAAPIIGHHSKVLDPTHNLPPDYPLITDEQLDDLQDAFVRAAQLAAVVGFDAVDIKSCHRYLISELLAGFTRENSRYGGSFENRTRMLRETVEKVRQAVGDRLEVTCRVNAYDAIEYPYGWGVDQADASRPDLSDPNHLLADLAERGVNGANITIANPYFNPHVNRPADWLIANWPDVPEQPLAGVARLISIVRDIQQANPSLTVVGSGYSWLRQYFPHFAAGIVANGWASLCGLGRGALAYPNFARDIIQAGKMDPHKVCVACSSCTQIMRDGGRSGCVVRDHEVYGPIFREGRSADADVLRSRASQCRRCVDAMCAASCPAGVDVPGFLGALADGDEKRAYEILRKSNILPEICGAVCPVEVQCESACIQNYMEGRPIPIADIQRHLSRRAVEEGWAALDVPAEPTGRTVAIVGAGPAGISAAATLLERGHRVVVFDRSNAPGGKLLSAIPSSRLDPQRVAAEIQAIFQGVGEDRLEWRLPRALGAKFTLDELVAEGYDAVLLAFGLGNSASFGSSPRPEGVIEAGAFLEHMKRNEDHVCPQRVAVLGGGNTAVDAAVCAKQRGGEDVYLLYRRSYEQMPAWPAERDEALHSGVHLMLLCQPVGYETDAVGKVTGVRLVRTQLGDPDEGGRRQCVRIPDSEFVVPAEMVIEAMGETMDPILANVLAGVELAGGVIQADPETFATTRKGVYAAGDAVNGGTTVVQAVAEGRQAARSIDRKLAGEKK